MMLALNLTACASSGTVVGDDVEPPSEPGELVASEAPRPASPLEEYLAPVWGTNISGEERQRQANEMSLRQEEIVAQCMQEAGFEYYPTTQEVVLVNATTPWRPDERDWVAQYGYGLVNSPSAEAEATPVYEENDPNREFLDSLSEAERNAYFETLYGTSNLDEEHVWTWEDGGCWGLAQHQTATATPADLMGSQEFAPLFEAINQLQNDPWMTDQMALIEREWVACMAEKGFPGYEGRWDAQNRFATEVQDFFSEWWDSGRDPNGTPEMEELGRREVELALADLDCRETVDYVGRINAAQFELETRFVADNRPALEALRTAAEQLS